MTNNRKPYGGRYREAVEGYAHALGLTRTQIAIAGAVASFANLDTGIAWPGNAKIAERARVSEKTLERNLPILKRAGVLIAWAYETGGRRKAVEYRFPAPQYSGYQRDPWEAGFEAAENHRQGDGGKESENHRHSVPKPPTFCPKTTDIVGGPSREKKKEEGNAVRAGRPRGGFAPVAGVAAEIRNGVTFGRLCDREGYAEAWRLWQSWA